MNLHWIDWVIVGAVMAGLTAVAWSAKRYTRSVADFLAASRSAGRYLLTVSEGAAGVGAITMVAYFEQFYQAGFPAAWWAQMLLPIGLILSLSGWVVYRFRETRALTLAQFFEMRYSRGFRVFAGILACASGVLNYAIFPAVTARFVIVFFGLPVHGVQLFGLELNLTLAAVMAAMLALALFFTFLGGQIAVMITDFIQSILFYVVFLVVIAVLLTRFGWNTIIETLQTAPEGHSMLNPFQQGGVPDFNVWFFVMSAVLTVYAYRAWQGNSGYNCAARSPHEARMAAILGGWRTVITTMIFLLVPVCAYVLLHNPQFTPQAEAVRAALEGIGDPQLRTQMTTPMALTQILPVGVFGLMCAVILCAALSTDDTYLLSWGSIFIQDVVLPFRKEPLSQAQHLRWLRRAVFGVAVFAFVFSLVFPLKDFILMWFTLTGAIFLGGAGSAIIGGLYWKRGTTTGAWAGMCAGSALAVTGIALRNLVWPHLVPHFQQALPGVIWLQDLPEQFPLNGMQLSFVAALAALSAYVVVSMLTRPDPTFDMDRMLHRGKYAVAGEHTFHRGSGIWRVLGMGSEFTRGDKAIYLFKIGWAGFWIVAFVVGTVYNLMFSVSEEAWAKWWLFYVVVMILMALITTIWFMAGGIRDLIHLFHALRTAQRDVRDDGAVVGHRLPTDRPNGAKPTAAAASAHEPE